MKINQLTLHNFGIYRDTVTYDFDTTDDKNIVLINGKNGAGKTTLLNAFKIALYGPYFLGYKTKVKEYSEYIKKRMNAYSLQSGDNKAYLTINFSLIEQGFSRTYLISRTWVLDGDNLEEELMITRDQKILTKKDSTEFIDELAEMLSPDYIDLFFFDGEKIDHLLAKSKSQEYIMAMFSKLFSLDLFDSLHNDLDSYVKQNKISTQFSSDEKYYEQALQEKQDKTLLLKDLTKMRIETENNINSLEIELSFEKEKFKNLGGLQSKEKQKIQHKISKVEHKRASKRSNHKSILNESFPFLLLTDELNELKQEIEIEKNHSNTLILLNQLKSQNFKTNYELTVGNSYDKLLETVHESFEIDTSLSLIHDLSNNDEQSLYHTINDISEHNITEIHEFYKEDRKLHNSIKSLNYRLHDSINTTLDDYTDLIISYEVKLASFKKDLESLTLQIEKATDQFTAIEANVIKQYSKLKDSKKIDNTYMLIKSINSVVTQFASETRKEKLTELQLTVTSIFKTLIRKEDFIADIQINLDTEQFQILNKTGSLVPEENLSAGERQIFILSILWGLLKISNRKIPIVFDTLLGRLDKTHKYNIINHFLHDLGQQIIILATDTEIDDDYVNMLSPYISQHYHISYDEESESVVLETIGGRNEL